MSMQRPNTEHKRTKKKWSKKREHYLWCSEHTNILVPPIARSEYIAHHFLLLFFAALAGLSYKHCKSMHNLFFYCQWRGLALTHSSFSLHCVVVFIWVVAAPPAKSIWYKQYFLFFIIYTLSLCLSDVCAKYTCWPFPVTRWQTSNECVLTYITYTVV